MLSECDADRHAEKSDTASNGEIHLIFKDVKDCRTSNVMLHDFFEMIMIALHSSLCDRKVRISTTDFATINEVFLHRFMRLEH